MQFNIISSGTSETIAVFIDGKLLTCSNDPSDPRNYDEIRRRVLDGDESVAALFDISSAANESFKRLSDRIVIHGGIVKFDGDPMNAEISRVVGNFVSEGHDLVPIINFLDRLMQNPNEHSRDQLFRWTRNQNLTITDTGLILAYKGVANGKDGGYVSIHSGTAWVNDVKHEGQIPNNEGDIITMPRSEVTFDPENGCSFGLHAGTWEYASSFGHGITLKVLIDPRDVVSVPSDCSDQKMRVCRYEVLEVTEKKIESSFYDQFEDDDDDYDDDDFYSSYEEDASEGDEDVVRFSF